jgi:hypothetical protein
VAGGESDADGKHLTQCGRRAFCPLPSTGLRIGAGRKGNSRSECCIEATCVNNVGCWSDAGSLDDARVDGLEF